MQNVHRGNLLKAIQRELNYEYRCELSQEQGFPAASFIVSPVQVAPNGRLFEGTCHPVEVLLPGAHKDSRQQGLHMVRILAPRENRAHRTQVQCHGCGDWVPAGRYGQHKCKTEDQHCREIVAFLKG